MDTNIQRLTSEEETIISDAYQKYYSRMYTYVYYSVNKNRDVTEDIVADTFALACEKIEIFATHENQIGWLYKTAQNKIKEFWHRWHVKVACDSGDVEMEQIDDSEYIRKEMEIAILRGLTKEEHCRYLRYFIWGYTLQEMADLEGITKDNMSVRLSRLRKKIMGELL